MNDAPAISDYAVIGDCQSAALIARDGSLDWLCWPRFDSAPVFAGLLDAGKGGSWKISPRGMLRSSRRYLPGTNVLEARFHSASGVVTLTDFMPLADEAYSGRHLSPDHAIVRILRCEAGTTEVDVLFSPRPHFAQSQARIVGRGKLGLRVDIGHGMYALHANARFAIEGGTAITTLNLKAGDEVPLILTYSEDSPEVLPLLDHASASCARTIAWWKAWSAQNTYDGPYRTAVERSVLTLKLLEYPASGAFVAAVTTSLPERIGGELNWDYRYCWLRDSSFTLDALCSTGFSAEAEAFSEWLLHATRRTQPKLSVMYDVYGNPAPRERVMEHLAGYRGSRPVRVGNGARDQMQLDTYGEVVSGAARFIKHSRTPADRETSKVLIGFGKYVCKHWREPDAGIWEERGQLAVHTHSRLLCWVALDALLDLDKRGLIRGVPAGLFETTRAEIRHAIETESWKPEAGSYSSEPGGNTIDATLLLLAVHGFHEASSERMRTTHEKVYRELGAGGSLLYRNLPDDGQPVEGAFGICGFWRVNFLARGGGTLEEAERAFRSLLDHANDVGLFAEEIDPANGEALGNFPQAFTHVGLINAAIAIECRRHSQGGAK